jgi:hypothetical protein
LADASSGRTSRSTMRARTSGGARRRPGLTNNSMRIIGGTAAGRAPQGAQGIFRPAHARSSSGSAIFKQANGRPRAGTRSVAGSVRAAPGRPPCLECLSRRRAAHGVNERRTFAEARRNRHDPASNASGRRPRRHPPRKVRVQECVSRVFGPISAEPRAACSIFVLAESALWRKERRAPLHYHSSAATPSMQNRAWPACSLRAGFRARAHQARFHYRDVGPWEETKVMKASANSMMRFLTRGSAGSGGLALSGFILVSPARFCNRALGP